MATQLNLTTLTDQHTYIQKIKKALVQAVGQEIPIINVSKVKRTGGVSASPVEFIFAGGQSLLLFIRAGADAFKAKLNGKEIVLSGDFSNDLKMTFNNGVDGVARLIRNGQKKFEASRNREKVKIPQGDNDGTKSQRAKAVTAQIADAKVAEKEIDQQIIDKTAIRDDLIAKIEQAKQLQTTQLEA